MSADSIVLAVIGVHYNTKKSHIDEVVAFLDYDQTSGETNKYGREEIVSFLHIGGKAFTYLLCNGKYCRCAEITRLATGYIRTDANSFSADNLENLPEY